MSMELWQQQEAIRHSQHLLHSYKHWTGNDLLDLNGSSAEIAAALFAAPIYLVSHGTEPDPRHQHCGQATVFSHYKFL